MGSPDSKIIEEANKLGMNEMSSERKSFTIMDGLNIYGWIKYGWIMDGLNGWINQKYKKI